MEKIPAPIDNKNLMEDGFVDDVFRDFYYATDHRKNSVRHLLGTINLGDNDKELLGMEAYVDVKWKFGDASITITLLAYNPCESLDDIRDAVFNHYRSVFKAWECDENPDLVVDFYQLNDKLNVIFYFYVED